MDGVKMTFIVDFLLKRPFADWANVFRSLAALDIQVAYQTALVLVGPAAVVIAKERLGHAVPI